MSNPLTLRNIVTVSLIIEKGGVSGTICICSQDLYSFDKSLIS